ncbi:AraC family transcriptional regulator [Nonomuraea gerenzanensis]|uniref:Transcriptional regulator, AraC family n=1 Tax=Nonomuraea gerenzanensis TaxID=93944 RepID=A0A1M4E1B1_9ACTN|nr:AraC family transcriptional regulator [Nonomuraea gerenzanensis]UBU14859.1 AraC family transcriptional regulator [Nonomuraea gerenzanensis]SBO92591.1 Transcriptional regulator, AraC family [Nonomuraea gerenzanensis]
MDVLSDVVAFMRAGRPTSARISWRAPWGVSFPAEPASAGFHVVLCGSCWLLPPEGEPVRLSVGDVVFVPHGDAFGLADDPARPLVRSECGPHAELFGSAGFEGSGAETVLLSCGYRTYADRRHPILSSLPAVIHLPSTLGRHPELRAAVDLLAGEIGDPRPGADTIVSSLLDMVQLYILRAWFDSDGEPCTMSGWAAALADPAIGRALNAIHCEPGRRWTVESLGAHAGLSRAGFARRFTALVGQAPLAYLTWWRLASAARMLRESDASVAEVAERVGYSSEFAFGNAFKREYGVAPGRFRRCGTAA